MTQDRDPADSGDAVESTDEHADGFDLLSGSRRDVLYGITAGTLATALGVVGTSGTALADEHDDNDDDSDVGASSSAAVEFRNQKTDRDEITVEKTCLSSDGYVAIHDASLLEGEVLDSVIG